MTVITMSRQIGSGAEEIAQRLCADLDLVAFDKRLMARVASEVGFSENAIVDYSETEYRRRGFFESLFRRNRSVAEFTSWAGGRASGFEREVQVMDEARAIDLIRATAVAAYERGNVLIIGRGCQVILEDKPGVFHVRVVAPYEERVQRLRDERQLLAVRARRLIQERDRATAEYLRTFHHIDVDDPTLYHMVLNTAKLTIDKCVALIKDGVQELAVEAAAA
jgi:cytidylate kinase